MMSKRSERETIDICTRGNIPFVLGKHVEDVEKGVLLHVWASLGGDTGIYGYQQIDGRE